MHSEPPSPFLLKSFNTTNQFKTKMDVISVIAVTCAILVGIAILALILSLLNSVISKNNSDKEYLPLGDGTNEMEMGNAKNDIIKNGGGTYLKSSPAIDDEDLDFKPGNSKVESAEELLEVENENINGTANDQSETISDESKSNKCLDDDNENIPVEDTAEQSNDLESQQQPVCSTVPKLETEDPIYENVVQQTNSENQPLLENDAVQTKADDHVGGADIDVIISENENRNTIEIPKTRELADDNIIADEDNGVDKEVIEDLIVKNNETVPDENLDDQKMPTQDTSEKSNDDLELQTETEVIEVQEMVIQPLQAEDEVQTNISENDNEVCSSPNVLEEAEPAAPTEDDYERKPVQEIISEIENSIETIEVSKPKELADDNIITDEDNGVNKEVIEDLTVKNIETVPDESLDDDENMPVQDTSEEPNDDLEPQTETEVIEVQETVIQAPQTEDVVQTNIAEEAEPAAPSENDNEVCSSPTLLETDENMAEQQTNNENQPLLENDAVHEKVDDHVDVIGDADQDEIISENENSIETLESPESKEMADQEVIEDPTIKNVSQETEVVEVQNPTQENMEETLEQNNEENDIIVMDQHKVLEDEPISDKNDTNIIPEPEVNVQTEVEAPETEVQTDIEEAEPAALVEDDKWRKIPIEVEPALEEIKSTDSEEPVKPSSEEEICSNSKEKSLEKINNTMQEEEPMKTDCSGDKIILPSDDNIEAISDVPCDEIPSKTLSDQDVSEIIDDELEIPIIKEEVIENNVEDSEKISLESPPPLPPPGKHSSNIRGLCLLK